MSGNERGDDGDGDTDSPDAPKRSNQHLGDGDGDGRNAMEFPPAKRAKLNSPNSAEKIVPVSRQPKALKSVLKGTALAVLHAERITASHWCIVDAPGRHPEQPVSVSAPQRSCGDMQCHDSRHPTRLECLQQSILTAAPACRHCCMLFAITARLAGHPAHNI